MCRIGSDMELCWIIWSRIQIGCRLGSICNRHGLARRFIVHLSKTLDMWAYTWPYSRLFNPSLITNMRWERNRRGEKSTTRERIRRSYKVYDHLSSFDLGDPYWFVIWCPLIFPIKVLFLCWLVFWSFYWG